MHRQVPVVAVLLIVQGSLEIGMGLLNLAMGPAMMAMLSLAPPPSSSTGGPPPDQFFGIMGAFYVVMGLVVAAAGIVKIVAGIKNLKYRSKIFGIVALGSNAVSFLTCYCLPTGLGLLIYGLIVYLNARSGQAFAMGEQGMGAEEIKMAVDYPHGYGGYGGYPPPPGAPPGYGGGYPPPPGAPPGYGGYPPR